MSKKFLGFRVVTDEAADDFDLEQAARQAVQMLVEAGKAVRLYRVLDIRDREVLEPLKFQPFLPGFMAHTSASHITNKEA